MKHRSGILLFLLNWLWSQMCKDLNEYRQNVVDCLRMVALRLLNSMLCCWSFILNQLGADQKQSIHVTQHRPALSDSTWLFSPSPLFCCFCSWMKIHTSPTSCGFCDELFWSTWVINLFPAGILLSRTITKPSFANQQTGCTDPRQ